MPIAASEDKKKCGKNIGHGWTGCGWVFVLLPVICSGRPMDIEKLHFSS
jgi:hypothetical protein